jgi:hypothetical protein
MRVALTFRLVVAAGERRRPQELVGAPSKLAHGADGYCGRETERDHRIEDRPPRGENQETGRDGCQRQEHVAEVVNVGQPDRSIPLGGPA